MTDVVLESPLSAMVGLGQRVLSADGQSCTLAEIAFVEMLNLRGNPADARFVQVVQDVTGLALPLQPNTASLGAQRQLLWLGPDEWLLKLRDGQGEAVAAALRAALQDQHVSLVQVGSGNTTLTLQGAGAATLLSRGCPLDFHARVFAAGSLAQSHVAKAGATILCLQAGSSYELTVRRSFADYLYRWLCEAGA
jgi:sarcosine oxidase subunit gamma